MKSINVANSVGNSGNIVGNSGNIGQQLVNVANSGNKGKRKRRRVIQMDRKAARTGMGREDWG